MLRHTLSDFKNELLFKDYGINYAKIDEIFRKGTLLVKYEDCSDSKKQIYN